MIHTRIVGISITVLALSINCSGQLPILRVGKLEPYVKTDFDLNFKAYSKLDSSQNFELNAVVCSFVADYAKAHYYASRKQAVRSNDFYKLSPEQREALKVTYTNECNDANLSEGERETACKILDGLTRPQDLNELFVNYRATNAVDYISKESTRYNTVLINEAHFSGQHRAFTSSILDALWDRGFRYLAIETLDMTDSLTQTRKYPSLKTGYYSKELAYSNFIRHALELGYQLVSYDVEERDVIIRDSLQALNIYNKTFKNDPNAKVIVHAGYAHIVEIADRRFTPMGFRLKQLLNRDVFTIDQTAMVGYSEISKRHPYYQHVVSKNKLSEPLVFLNVKDKSLVDPVHSLGIDCQVYHPEVKITFNHPDFLHDEKKRVYALPDEFKTYRGHLLQINAVEEDESAVPLDRVLITREQVYALLKPGSYVGYLIDQNGAAVWKFRILAR